ncbi:small GTP-binding protein, putative [Trichomonas vaginalis G3]|uniref:Small GTP-binding protein, putative n=2 Tax=Trichomonas vaginalis TaxID=5722 RepID=A0A8U0WPM6_TRIV3|nr:small Rab GTPase RabC1 [Trichomonas vaginalis G3]AAX97467.1 small Rab GTPase RabC1 [Trichomonas vaginalis]EAY11744.1 small GTP-binding protein, putative [Trichomonas vaginalis G3]KAI5540595.1 small Rab GTPase RabC1 [Trichomonas vaginalis G3]|eukprot:XP_001323967.1 small GTP-binding protein [Trichomonas vaginalis G3]
MRSLKVVLVGDTKVGKSCVLSRFVQGTFDRNMPATIGAAFLTKVITTSSGPVRLQLWDTAGQEKFRSLAPMYYRSSSVALMVYDVTQKESLDSLDDWASEIADKAPHNIKFVVIGNKCDMTEERVISTEMGKNVAQQLGATLFGETSAKTGEGISEIFSKIAELDINQEEIIETTTRVQNRNSNGEQGGCNC